MDRPSVLEALYIALLGLALPAAWRTRGSAPVVIAGLWVAQEALRDRTPYGGFPWARLAFSQTDAPTLHLAALGGAPLVSFAIALAGALLAYAVRQRAPRMARPVWAPSPPSRSSPAGCWSRCRRPAGRSRWPESRATCRPAGLDFDDQRAAVLDLHAKGALQLAAQVAGRARARSRTS